MGEQQQWDPSTMSISKIMDSISAGKKVLHHKHYNYGSGYMDHDFNFALQLVRFFDRAVTTLTVRTENRVLYFGKHGNVVSTVLTYFPMFQVTVCNTTEISDPDQYKGWHLIYDHQINYGDLLNDSLAKRGLTINDNAGNYIISYRQAIVEAMNNHHSEINGLLEQQRIINNTLKPISGLWRFTLPWSHSSGNVVAINGEIWPSIWGSPKTRYSWLVTSSPIIGLASTNSTDDSEKIYDMASYSKVLKYYNSMLRGLFYQNPYSGDGQPPDYAGLDNSWDSWATVNVLKLLNARNGAELISIFDISTRDDENITINDPFVPDV